MGKPLIVMVLGVITGYCYIFLKVTVKENYGVDVLKPPAFLYECVNRELGGLVMTKWKSVGWLRRTQT